MISKCIFEYDHKCEIRNTEQEVDTDGYSQTRGNPWVDRYGSGFGLAKVIRLGFWTGLEPNWPVFAVQTRTTGGLPGPVVNTRLRRPLSVKKNPKPQTPWNPGRSQLVNITSSLPRASPWRLHAACAELAPPDSAQSAESQHVQPAKSWPMPIASLQLIANRPRNITEWVCQRCLDYLQLVKSQPVEIIFSWPRSACPHHIKLAMSQPILTMSSKLWASPSTGLDRLQKFVSQPVQITSRSRTASRTRQNCIQPVESKPVSIGSRHLRASISKSRLTTRGRARPDHL